MKPKKKPLFENYEAFAADPPSPDIKRSWVILGGTSEYRVDLDQHDEWACTCKDYEFKGKRRRPRGCKHSELVERLLAETSTRCPCSFPHPPHDYCDGNPDAAAFELPPHLSIPAIHSEL